MMLTSSFLSPQKLQHEVIDDDLDDDNDDDNDDDDNDNDDDVHFGMEYNATVYDGRENTVAAVHQARLSASLSSANIAATSCSKDLCTLIASFAAAINESIPRKSGKIRSYTCSDISTARTS